jgi:hypothetical protein
MEYTSYPQLWPPYPAYPIYPMMPGYGVAHDEQGHRSGHHAGQHSRKMTKKHRHAQEWWEE